MHDILVIGTSAGGYSTLSSLLSQLPSDFPAAVFIVQHISAESTGIPLINGLQSKVALRCKMGEDGESFSKGTIYFAPPDRHMLIKEKKILLTRGPTENRCRPAIDPLFRSAAAYYDSRVTGVILSGMLDDGVAGLDAIKRSGGIAVVQDPNDALYPEMPQNAIDNVKVDYCIPLKEMGFILQGVVFQPAKEDKYIPDDIIRETEIAERIITDIHAADELEKRTPYECPACGGGIWEVQEDKPKRYRCHAGHAYTSNSFFKAKSEKLEEALWISLRMLEERKNIFSNSAEYAKKREMTKVAALQEEKVNKTREDIEAIRRILLSIKN